MHALPCMFDINVLDKFLIIVILVYKILICLIFSISSAISYIWLSLTKIWEILVSIQVARSNFVKNLKYMGLWNKETQLMGSNI
jgi:hypothetical protein